MQPWVYRWGLLFEYSITSYWVGDLRASLEACDRLLALPDLPDPYRRQTLLNRGFALQRLPVPAAGLTRSRRPVPRGPPTAPTR